MNVNSVRNKFILEVIMILSQIYVYRKVHTIEQNKIFMTGTKFGIICPVNPLAPLLTNGVTFAELISHVLDSLSTKYRSYIYLTYFL